MPPDPLTPTERAELRRLASEASALPWTHGLDLDPPDPGIEASGGGCVCHVQCHANINTVVREREEFSHADAAYLVAAANSVPRLLAMLEAAEAERDCLRDSLRSCEDQLIAVADYFGAKCGEGLPPGSGDTLAAAIIRRAKGQHSLLADAVAALEPFLSEGSFTLLSDRWRAADVVAKAKEALAP